jgi:alkaline phosphatase D
LKHIFAIAAFALSIYSAQAQKAKLFAGPMVGSVTKTSAKIWIGYRGKGKNAVILGDTSTKKIYYPTNYSYLASNGVVALTFDFTGLQPNHVYNVLVSIEGWKTQARTSFRTQADVPVKDFAFSTGSCALMNTDWSKPIFPGGKTNIFNAIRKRHSEFMLWLGDNVYYMKASQYNTVEGMFERNMKVRTAFKKFKFFITAMPHYAIWDDHDFGPNDSNDTWHMKDSSLMIFKSFWPNTYPEQPQLYGNFFSFRYYDAEFFMTDDRYYRDPPGDSAASFLGAKQMAWLKERLLLSDAAFKFIAVGTQVLNENNFGETYSQYPKERQDLFEFIAKNNIKGVIFLTGDKHYSEICRKEVMGYPILDFTSSPLTSPPLPRRLLGAFSNPTRISNTDYGRHSFGHISLSGPAGDRKCTIEIINRFGRKEREFTVAQSELQRRKE